MNFSFMYDQNFLLYLTLYITVWPNNCCLLMGNSKIFNKLLELPENNVYIR